MPSIKILEQKQTEVATLTEKIQNSVSGVIVSYAGITVEADTKLRKELREAGVEYKVYKNSITGRACENAGYGDIKSYLEGMVAIAVSKEDAVAPAKILKKYADEIPTFEIKAGYIDGEVIGAEKVEALAKIPPKPVLVAKTYGQHEEPCFQARYLPEGYRRQSRRTRRRSCRSVKYCLTVPVCSGGIRSFKNIRIKHNFKK